jgi:prepilin-type N-terminal cleavage/methylation domain-containing protein
LRHAPYLTLSLLIGMLVTAPHHAAAADDVAADKGFSLVEVLIVVCLVAIVGAMAVPVAADFINDRKSDSAVVATMTAIKAARDRAIAERRNIQLDFPSNSRIVLSRVEVPSGVTTQVSHFTLENGQIFVKFGSVPDTPDQFGAATAQTFSGTPPVMFTSDGSLIDSAGDVVNGSIFVGLPSQPLTARAVTIFGVTGRRRR